MGEEAAVERFIAACRQGSPQSAVSLVRAEEAPAEDIAGFEQADTL